MIVEWFVNFVGDLFVSILDLVTGVLPATLDLGDLSGAFGLMRSLDALFPVSECIAGFLVILTVTGVMFAIKLVQAAVAHIPLVGGSGG